MSAEQEYEKVVEYLASTHDGVAGQMFGKKCIKINNKAGVALFKDFLVFKLPENIHSKAMSLTGSVLWDPSGKGRPMKEWVQVAVDHKQFFKEFADASANYVG
jgi:hypothetical protein